MSTDIQQIAKSKNAARQRLRELPWLEKLEMLDRMRERHLFLQGASVVHRAARKK